MIERIKRSAIGGFVVRYMDADAGLYATAIAYRALFSVFPILLALWFLLGQILSGPNLLAQVTDIVNRFFPGDAAEAIVEVLHETRGASGLLGVIGLLGLLWAGSAIFGALAHGFNRIYRVPDRPLIRRQIVAVGMIFLFAALLLISFVASAAAQLLIQLAGALPVGELPLVAAFAGSAAAFLISFVAALVMFLTVYLVMPNVRQSPRGVLPGALLAALLFVLLLQAFPVYARYVGRFDRFGALFGFSFLLLTWLYFVAHVTLIGATLNATRIANPEPRVR